MIGVKKMTTGKVEKKERNKRVPFGVARSKLSVAKLIEGYHLRWINDEPGRLQQAMNGGYSFVEPSEVDWEENGDTKVKVLGGAKKDGSALYIYLMKIPMEFHLEDVAEAQGNVDKIDSAILQGQSDREGGDGRYVPKGGISYKP